ncbi:MAG: cytochrome P450 [Methylobacteriaceae bacterium]|nr:cytochrome P450 [Methylobacteriaceae bacterium]
MLDGSIQNPGLFRPPAPAPRAKPLSLIALLGAVKHNPLEVWTKEHFENAIVTSRVPFFQATVVSHPRAVQRILLDNVGNYRRADLQRRILSAGLSDGLLTAEGEQWRVQRHAIAPMLARKAVQNFVPAMMEVAERLVARWLRHPDGDILDVAAEVTQVTLEVLERTIFSDGLKRDPAEFRTAMRGYFDAIGRLDPADVLGLPGFVPRLSRWRARPTLRFFDAAVDDIIAHRRRLLAETPDAVPRDILTLLLEAHDPQSGRGLSEAELRGNIITLIAAGHETTANALAWSLFLLSQSEEWRERVAAEADREFGGDIDGLADRLVETRAVIEEALRLYPPIVATSRVAIEPDELAGTPVRAGAMVVVAPYVLHRHRLLWERPDIFDPHRFLGEARREIDRYAYLPFGAGPRICVGAAFALQEATLVLSALVRNFELALAPGFNVEPLLRITLRPKGGLAMIVRRRKAPRRAGRQERVSEMARPSA